MCRIAGIVSKEDSGKSARKIKEMTDALAHGGPDDEGIYQHDTVTLGHRRLSIIDLSSAGHQPMTDASGSYVICFNGEIYNYRELKAELDNAGVRFKTATDTEVIIESYKKWGAKAFGRFRGIFAFALYDVNDSKLLLVRDSPGIKPLYYSVAGGQLLFSSEVKAFKAFDPSWQENPHWRSLFLAFGYLPHDATTLKDVFALEPGSAMEFDVKAFTIKKYFFSEEPKSTYSTTAESLLHVKASVLAALKRNIIADAPLGIFLSGGIDSSLLALLASKEIADNERTVSVTFSEAAFDESPYQKLVLNRIQHSRHLDFPVSESTFWDSLDNIWQAMDQPTIDGVNSYFVSMAAHKSGLKAVLSGLGADELFGGYASSSRETWLKYLRNLPAKDTVAAIAGNVNNAYRRLSFLKMQNALGDYLFLRGIHTPSSIAKILQCGEREVYDTLATVREPEVSEISKNSYASFLEFNFYMKGQLLKDTDFMSMWFGLETRVPFLDQEVIREAAGSIASKEERQSQPKFLLTRSFEDVLPREIVFRKKHGFTFPFHVWLKNRIDSGDRMVDPRLAQSLPIDRFLKGAAHWSQVWSGVVLDRFKWK